MIKVKDNPELVRDEKSKAILNVNQQALDNYKMQRERLLKDSPIISLQKEISELKKQIEELKAIFNGA